MLPKVTLSRPFQKYLPASRAHPGRPRCAAEPDLFTDRDRVVEAAKRCQECPLSGPCLVRAFELHRARAAHRDLWGATGCWAGVWFEPGHAPEHIELRQAVA